MTNEMNTAEVQTEDEPSNVIPFKKTPQPNSPVSSKGEVPTDQHWLREIPPGHMFWTRPQNNRNPAVSLFQVLFHSEKCTKLYEGTTQKISFWVHTNDFSIQNVCLEVLALEAPQEEEQENGTTDRADPL